MYASPSEIFLLRGLLDSGCMPVLIFLIPVAVCQPEPELLENLRHCISYWILKTVAVCQSENNHGTCGCMPRLVKVNLKLIIFCKFH